MANEIMINWYVVLMWLNIWHDLKSLMDEGYLFYQGVSDNHSLFGSKGLFTYKI